jgi:hypothetical protein
MPDCIECDVVKTSKNRIGLNRSKASTVLILVTLTRSTFGLNVLLREMLYCHTVRQSKPLKDGGNKCSLFNKSQSIDCITPVHMLINSLNILGKKNRRIDSQSIIMTVNFPVAAPIIIASIVITTTNVSANSCGRRYWSYVQINPSLVFKLEEFPHED